MNSNKDKKIKNNTRSRINVNQNKVSNSICKINGTVYNSARPMQTQNVRFYNSARLTFHFSDLAAICGAKATLCPGRCPSGPNSSKGSSQSFPESFPSHPISTPY